MESTSMDRRTVLRHGTVLGSTLVGAVVSGCVDDAPDPGFGNGESPAGMTLEAGTKIGLAFTGPGGVTTVSTVDPEEPGGGRLLTLEDVEPGASATVSWRETIERESTPSERPTVGVGEDTPTPIVEVVERSGTLTVAGLDDAHATFLPMFWDPGTATTDTSGIWLSREAYRELRDTRSTAWSADVLTRISWVGTEIQDRIDDAVERVDEVVLAAEGDFIEVDLTVNGTSTTVEAIEAHDSFGNRYVVLANEADPMVVRFRYDAVSVGGAGLDTALWSVIKAVFSGYQVLSIESA